ncbi:protoporphyrinogen oxidase [Paenibacillus xerothermodurans]|uniref:Coproporphyrinogen III oxidase n=1 Tax=Paenibacillus xerothermodurans TaxID=1977292 RepID=A0A2W1NEY8_PAEXE|nr:protoporphyrinogen oxidase [Paenibacillus xerothermodurans]PZE21611.1 protoporphyrinogen oxidase [Paenibacillus xerothermodurans]
MKTIVIIGGGITGLATAYYLEKTLQAEQREAKIVLLEADAALGGKIRTVQEGEFIMEAGADSIVARKTNVSPLLHELDLQEAVVYNATGVSFIYTDGELKQIPKDAVFGIPLSLESLATTELVSAQGKVDALRDLYTPNEAFTKEDSIGAFLQYFLGKELVEKQISPVLSGVYSGRLEDLTIASTLPYLLDYKNEYGSIIQGLSANKQKFQANGDKKFLSFQHGVSSLIDRLAERLTVVDVYRGVRAEKVEKRQDGYTVTCSNHTQIEADFIVLSVLHDAARSLMNDERLDKEFEQLKNSSLISVYLGFDIPDSQLPKDGTGFIAAEDSGLKCNACTWTSRKWQHTSAQHNLLVRLFYKSVGPHYEMLQQMTEEQLKQVARKDIQDSMGITATPVSVEVTKWHNSMPNYHLKHPQIVRSLENQLAERYPNVLLAGASYYGVGIPDCIANGEQTARKIAERL